MNCHRTWMIEVGAREEGGQLFLSVCDTMNSPLSWMGCMAKGVCVGGGGSLRVNDIYCEKAIFTQTGWLPFLTPSFNFCDKEYNYHNASNIYI